jgi:SAM-dependent methyltransferase
MQHTSEDYLSEYDPGLVDQWDEVVDWKDRAEREGAFFLSLLRDAGAKSVLDIATGTGFHAVEFAKAGFDVVAVDGAPEMVAVARENLKSRGLDDVPCDVGDWRFLDTLPERKFDAVVCLGNSMAHLSNPSDLAQSLASFHHLLNPGGMLIADQRNYDGIIAGTVTGKERNYCCTGLKSTCDLKVMSSDTVQITYAANGHAPHSILTHAWRVGQIQDAMRQAGFDTKELFGENGAPFEVARSEFAIHIATKASLDA